MIRTTFTALALGLAAACAPAVLAADLRAKQEPRQEPAQTGYFFVHAGVAGLALTRARRSMPADTVSPKATSRSNRM